MTGSATIQGSPASETFVVINSVNNLNLSVCKTSGSVPQVVKSHNNSKNGDFCFVKTNAQGKFVFETVPHGSYKISFVDSNADGVKFDSANLEIKHSLKNQKNSTFELDGVVQKLVGKTVSESGKGIKDVVIKVDGENVAKTNVNGEFILEDVRNNPLKISILSA